MNQAAAKRHDQAGEPPDQFLGELRFGPKFPSKSHIVAGGLTVLLGLSFLLAGRTLDLARPWAALAIILAGSLGFLLLGFRPGHGTEGEIRLRVGLITTAILLALVTSPLATVFVRSAAVSQTRSAIDRVVTRQLEQMSEARLVTFEFQDHGDELEVTIIAYAPEPISADATTRLKVELAKAVAKPVRLRLLAIPVAEMEIFSERPH